MPPSTSRSRANTERREVAGELTRQAPTRGVAVPARGAVERREVDVIERQTKKIFALRARASSARIRLVLEP